MTRAEVYAKVKEYELQDVIKNKYGFNYTNLSTATLLAEVVDYEETQYTTTTQECYCCGKINHLIDLLYKKHLICKKEYESLMA